MRKLLMYIQIILFSWPTWYQIWNFCAKMVMFAVCEDSKTTAGSEMSPFRVYYEFLFVSTQSSLNVHHTCKYIMHFFLFSLTQILWSPVNNQPGKGFAVFTHCICCSFVPVYWAHWLHSAENWNAAFFSPYFWSVRSKGFPSNQKKKNPEPSFTHLCVKSLTTSK